MKYPQGQQSLEVPAPKSPVCGTPGCPPGAGGMLGTPRVLELFQPCQGCCQRQGMEV